MPSAVLRIPPLQQGDHLTVEEFLRRYQAMPPEIKAELIEGVVYLSSPVNQEGHGGPTFDFISWLGYYRVFTPGVQGGDNSTVQLKLGLNIPQPDSLLRILEECGGQSRIDEEGYIVGSPELIGEISASSVSYDLHIKLPAYQRNGVKEYVVWRVLDRAIDWFILKGGKLKPLPLSREWYYKSRIFPGLWLDPAAMVRGDMARVMQVLQEGLATPEHRKFVEKLKKRKGDI